VLLVVTLAYFAWDKFTHDAASHELEKDLVENSTEPDHAIQQSATTEPDQESNVPDKNSIAVLPFVNMSSDPEQEYFSDGITEEVLNLLAKIPELKVTSRSSVFSFKGQNIDIPTVAEKLGVTHILEGSVRKSGNRVRITAQLIEAESDVHMWSETYDRELNDIFAIQDEIAEEVVTVLQVQLLGKAPHVQETDAEAYAAYLQGLHFLQSESPNARAAAVDAFESATKLDPDYSPAWAGLGRALRSQANWGEIEHNPGTEAARKAVLKALELDETSAEAWASLARIQWVYDWDWLAAEGTVKTALMYGPNNTTALMNAAYVAKTLGQFEKAIELGTRAAELDPLNAEILTDLSTVYWSAHRFEECIRVLERILKLYPDNAVTRARIAAVMVLQGRSEEAWQLVQKEPVEASRHWAGAFILHDLGRTDEARQSLAWLVENTSDWFAYQIAEIHAALGQTDKAFEWLETAYAQRDGGVTHILGDAAFDSMHNDPRWEPFLLKLGLLDAWNETWADRWGTGQ
jgi:TolB-like protein/cytochrome c-type biogenesis protein CcmH/NrfG